jgi:hypothetical protein
MRCALLVVAVTLAAAPAFAQSPARQSDLAPAAPTAGSGPDAGNSYQYPPNTGKILAPANRTPYDPPPGAADGSAKPLSATGTGGATR